MRHAVFTRFFACLMALFICAALPLPAFGEEEEAVTLDWDNLDTDLSVYQRFQGQNISINVYNWGEYISDGGDGSMDINKEFESLTGIKVNYLLFASNEELYAKLKNGGSNYDVIIPSDYMINRLMQEGMLQPLDFSNIPNLKNVDQKYMGLEYDPESAYSVPYTWGWWASSTTPRWWTPARTWRPGTCCGTKNIWEISLCSPTAGTPSASPRKSWAIPTTAPPRSSWRRRGSF